MAMPPKVAQPREMGGTGIWETGDVISIVTLPMNLPHPADKIDFKKINISPDEKDSKGTGSTG
jgi:hypothetical protein